VGAQTQTTSTWQLGVGSTRVLDTYLSAEKFSGQGLTLLHTSERRRDGRQWSFLSEHELNVATVDDRAAKRDELQGSYTLLAGPLRRWDVGSLTLQAGAMGALDVGFIYHTSNSNNPAQARLSLTVMPTAAAAYGLTLWRRRLLLRYELQLPMVGLMFSPNYGQSYYELFSLGHYDRNVVPTTFVSAPTFRQQLSVEYPVSRLLSLRLGYLGHYQQSSVNNLKSHVLHHRVMIGVVRSFTLMPLQP
jgi:hypothetical protein